MKKTLILLSSALLFAFFCVTARAAALGDVDNDGSITAYDARQTLRAAVHLEPAITPETEAFTAADADFDGAITSGDARAVLRAAVKLEDLNDRLPESEALSENELRQRFRDCCLHMKIYIDVSTVSFSFDAYVIDDNGTVAIPYSYLRNVIYISVDREDCFVESILYTDPAANLALLKLAGDVPRLSVNRTWFDNGDPVFGYSGVALLRGTISPIPAGAENAKPETTLCAAMKYVNLMYELDYSPLLDRFGRAVGFIMCDETVQNKRYMYAIPYAKLPSPQNYNPKTVEEFSREQWRITLECSVDAIEIVQYGVAVVPFESNTQLAYRFSVNNPYPERIEARVRGTGSGALFLQLVAKQPCRDIPIEVVLKGRYETLTITVKVTVTTEGYINMVSVPVIPDPGVLWKCLPKEFTVGESSIELRYDKAKTGLSGEELFYSYAGVLAEMGYIYEKTEQIAGGIRYRFVSEDGIVHVFYTEEARDVAVYGYVDTTDLKEYDYFWYNMFLQ